MAQYDMPQPQVADPNVFFQNFFAVQRAQEAQKQAKLQNRLTQMVMDQHQQDNEAWTQAAKGDSPLLQQVTSLTGGQIGQQQPQGQPGMPPPQQPTQQRPPMQPPMMRQPGAMGQRPPMQGAMPPQQLPQLNPEMMQQAQQQKQYQMRSALAKQDFQQAVRSGDPENAVDKVNSRMKNDPSIQNMNALRNIDQAWWYDPTQKTFGSEVTKNWSEQEIAHLSKFKGGQALQNFPAGSRFTVVSDFVHNSVSVKSASQGGASSLGEKDMLHDNTLIAIANNPKETPERRKEAQGILNTKQKNALDLAGKKQTLLDRFPNYQKATAEEKKVIDTLVDQVHAGNIQPNTAMLQLKTLGKNLQGAFTDRYVDKYENYNELQLQSNANFYKAPANQKMIRNIKSTFAAMDEDIRLAKMVNNPAGTPLNKLTGAAKVAFGDSKRAMFNMGNLATIDEFNRIMGGQGGAVEYFRELEKRIDTNMSVQQYIDLMKEAKYYIATRYKEYVDGTPLSNNIDKWYSGIANDRPFLKENEKIKTSTPTGKEPAYDEKKTIGGKEYGMKGGKWYAL